MKTRLARSRLPLLLSIVAVLLVGCGAGYNYNPLEINCSVPPYSSVCAWSDS